MPVLGFLTTIPYYDNCSGQGYGATVSWATTNATSVTLYLANKTNGAASTTTTSYNVTGRSSFATHGWISNIEAYYYFGRNNLTLKACNGANCVTRNIIADMDVYDACMGAG